MINLLLLRAGENNKIANKISKSLNVIEKHLIDEHNTFDIAVPVSPT